MTARKTTETTGKAQESLQDHHEPETERDRDLIDVLLALEQGRIGSARAFERIRALPPRVPAGQVLVDRCEATVSGGKLRCTMSYGHSFCCDFGAP